MEGEIRFNPPFYKKEREENDLFLEWKMLTSVFRALVKNPVKESLYVKRKKKTINVLTVFFISHKSDVKIFLK